MTKIFGRLFKKLTAVTLAILMVAAVSTVSFAKSFDDVGDGNKYQTQIDILSDIGVIVGTSENEFSPDENVSRQQMALLLFRLMLARSGAGMVNTSPFTDLNDPTYFGAVSWAAAAGIIIGNGENTFDPDGGVTFQDALTMVVRALNQSSDKTDSGYPWSYIDLGIRLGLDDNLEDVGYSDTLTRAQVAALLYNALSAEYLVPRTTGGNTFIESTTVIENVYGYQIADMILAATNKYALEGCDTVIKNGYVSFVDENGNTITTPFESTGISGSAESRLGESFHIVYKLNSDKSASVLASSGNGMTVNSTSIVVASDNSTVTIGGVVYKIVSSHSDSLSTNANELIVYAYDGDATLNKVASAEALKEMLGYYNIEMIFDSASDTAASRAILTPYSFGQLIITNDKINLAGSLTAAQLTGGFTNTCEAENGSFVLYYFNPTVKELILAEKLAAVSGQVTALTSSYATINGQNYVFGNAAAGIDPDSIKEQVVIGSSINAIVKDGAILAVFTDAPETPAVQTYNYLITETTPVPVFVNGQIRYALNVYFNGEHHSILVNTPEIETGKVYRYSVNSEGIYTLIGSSSDSFKPASDILFNGNSVAAENIVPVNGAYYEYQGQKFVTDTNTVIIINNNGSFITHNGVFASYFELSEGAAVTAVLKDESGDVDTLKFMYITGGSLGDKVTTSQNVKVLASNGLIYENGTVYTSYTVFNFGTMTVETRKSLVSGLLSGVNYLLATDGTILDESPSGVLSGKIMGFTASTVTIDGETYRVTADTQVIKISGVNAAATTISALNGTTVEYILNGSTVTAIIG